MAFAGIHNRANGRKEVTSPVGAKTVRDLPKDRAHTNGLLTGVIGWRNRRIFQEHKQVIRNLEVALLQAPAMLVGRLQGQTARQTALQITAILIQRGFSQLVAAL